VPTRDAVDLRRVAAVAQLAIEYLCLAAGSPTRFAVDSSVAPRRSASRRTLVGGEPTRGSRELRTVRRSAALVTSAASRSAKTSGSASRRSQCSWMHWPRRQLGVAATRIETSPSRASFRRVGSLGSSAQMNVPISALCGRDPPCRRRRPPLHLLVPWRSRGALANARRLVALDRSTECAHRRFPRRGGGHGRARCRYFTFSVCRLASW